MIRACALACTVYLNKRRSGAVNPPYHFGVNAGRSQSVSAPKQGGPSLLRWATFSFYSPTAASTSDIFTPRAAQIAAIVSRVGLRLPVSISDM